MFENARQSQGSRNLSRPLLPGTKFPRKQTAAVSPRSHSAWLSLASAAVKGISAGNSATRRRIKRGERQARLRLTTDQKSWNAKRVPCPFPRGAARPSLASFRLLESFRLTQTSSYKLLMLPATGKRYSLPTRVFSFLLFFVFPKTQSGDMCVCTSIGGKKAECRE